VRRSIQSVLLVALVLTTGCGAAYRTLRWNTPDDVVRQYTFETVHDIETSLETLPAASTPDGLAAIEDKLREQRFTLSGTLEKRKAQYFRDGTSGYVITMSAIDPPPDDGGLVSRLDVDGLVGKSVAIRAFDSGEIFEAIGFEHFTGYGRFGDLFPELFSQLMMRLPPELPDIGNSIAVHNEVPLQLGPLCKLEHTWDVEFHRTGEPEPCNIGRACVELQYNGTLAEKGFNKEPRHVTEVVGSGTIRGTILLALDTRDFQEHRYEVQNNRTIRTFEAPFDRREGEEGVVRAVITQADHSETVLRRAR
jgi:hypothetical protein